MADTVSRRPYGVLGRALGHSYTPTIYRELAGLDYRRFEREPEELAAFLAGDEWEGVNVTIPYKHAVLPYLNDLSDTARRMGNVNTITRLPDGRLRGDNTDYFGFKVLVDSLGLKLSGKRAVIFGHGGAGSTCALVLKDLGMDTVFVGRKHDPADPTALTYGELAAKGADIALAVNCTPVGMWPDCPASVCSLDVLPALEGLIDIVYNPARTGLMMQAEERRLPHAGGLLMLVAQAAEAVERYTGKAISLERIREVTAHLSASEQNIVLIGMPGSGKTRVGEQLSSLMGREHVDIDHALEERLGMPCSAFIEREGEAAFRAQETETMSEVCGRSQLVISCGGGAVTRPENYPLAHQNAVIVMLNRPLAELSTKNRPITARDGIEKLARQRMDLYRAWADLIVDSRACAAATARAVLDELPPAL